MTPPEVLIYIQSVKEFLKKNESARDYFLSNLDSDLFFQQLEDLAIKNFTKNQDPILSKEQFEFLRLSLQTFKKIENEDNETNGKYIYDYVPGFGKFYFN